MIVIREVWVWRMRKRRVKARMGGVVRLCDASRQLAQRWHCVRAQSHALHSAHVENG